MKYRHLPKTDLDLSEVGFGVWTVSTGWWGKIDEPSAIKLLQNAFHLGINFYDTADTYGKGYGEEIIAKALPSQRHEIILATKFGYDFYDTPVRTGHQERPQRFDSQFIRKACEESLRRFKTDYIDIYQLHNPRLEIIEQDEVFETLDQLVSEGKIRYYGAALGPDIGWFEEGEASMRHRNVASTQIIYSILEQDPARRFFPIAEEQEVGLLSRVPHASEVLTDKYREPPEFDESDHRAHRKQEWLDAAIKKANSVRFLEEGTGRTLAQAAIKFCLAQASLVSVLPNITSQDELVEYAAAPETPDLVPEESTKLDELWEEGFYLEPVGTTSDD